jgi:hypothetical protein
MNATKLHVNKHWPAYRLMAIAVLFAVSLIWTTYDWPTFSLIKARAEGVAILGIGLALTEACFIIGAIVAAASVGMLLSAQGGFVGWWKNLRHARRNIQDVMQSITRNKLFEFGFWLNLLGAVGTSLLLGVAVVMLLPVVAWWILILLILDIAASLGWRIPLYRSRKAQKHNA